MENSKLSTESKIKIGIAAATGVALVVGNLYLRNRYYSGCLDAFGSHLDQLIEPILEAANAKN